MSIKKYMLLFLSVISIAYASERYPFHQPTEELRFKNLSSSLRCMVCRHQNLAESSAPLALDMKQKIYEKITQGDTDEAILSFLTERYGDAILFKPKLKKATLVLWFAPGILFLCSLWLIYKLVYRHKRI